MWPFNKKKRIGAQEISFSQVDTTERFDDDQGLDPKTWIPTTPLNGTMDNPEAMGLPPSDADEDEVYRIASKLSALRESIPIQSDGVYCPICHVANIDLDKLRKPCPFCGRELLKFGWD